ncbi:hypothetical protein P280DRAFT_444904 [Massarina eburnea CBS 473.64]|uniref:Rhodopsin domain-containing protein n=1 Tax=Massarina eburnea CBS 473.64 TaxID=1395130 RepID=A0A6A6S7R2_9PLEO|nr:hypothetical protein P280DRAFT_444904 [Massarina eburnea CBS 473.64]
MSTRTYVTATQLLNTSYGMMAITTAVVLARVAVQSTRKMRMALEDYLVYLAYTMYLSMSVMYIVVTPAMFRVTAAAKGLVPSYATLMDDALFLTRIFFTNSMIFWFVLWTIKFSLLALYRRLMVGLSVGYVRLWWAVFGFCALSLIGAIVSNFTSCHSWHAWWTPGECSEPQDVRAQIASLWYAYAVDVLSDLMIMFLPLRLVIHVQIPRARKISVMALFSSGLVCILFATIRVVQIGEKATNNTTPSSSWLALWAIVEGSIAVIIGCCPALYRKARKPNNDSSYSAQSYSMQTSNRSGRPKSGDPRLQSMVSSGSRPSDLYWETVNESQEELAHNGVMMTRTIR